MERFCVDCRYHKAVTHLTTWHMCTHPRMFEPQGGADIVTGEIKQRKFAFCDQLRRGVDSNECGYEGKLFESIPAKPLLPPPLSFWRRLKYLFKGYPKE